MRTIANYIANVYEILPANSVTYTRYLFHGKLRDIHYKTVMLTLYLFLLTTWALLLVLDFSFRAFLFARLTNFYSTVEMRRH